MIRLEEYFVGDDGEFFLNGFVQVVNFLTELSQFLDDVGLTSRRRFRRFTFVAAFFQSRADGHCVIHDPLQLDAFPLISLPPDDSVTF